MEFELTEQQVLLADSVRSSALDAGAAVARRCVARVRQPREGVRQQPIRLRLPVAASMMMTQE